MASVETVLGPVDAAPLGVVLSHEHVLVSGDDARHYPWRDDRARMRAHAIRELSEAKAGGIDTIIELTTPDLGRDVQARTRRRGRARPRCTSSPRRGMARHPAAHSGPATPTRAQRSSCGRSTWGSTTPRSRRA